MPKVTVIMPALNVAKYIRPCMDSVCRQTMKDLEILFIDAGSTDGTLEFIGEYAEKDERIQIIHSDKKSYGYQLNLGIAQACGDYVGIVETDDIIAENMFETLYESALEADADYVKGKAESFVDINGKFMEKYPLAPVFNDLDFYKKMVVIPGEMPEIFIRDVYLWTGIYKREFIRKIALNESPGAAYQDSGFMLQSYSKAKKAVYLPDRVYLYRQDNVNASNYDRRGFRYLIGEYAYMERYICELPQNWQEIFYRRLFEQCCRRFIVMAVSGEFWEDVMPEMEALRKKLQNACDVGLLGQEIMPEERWKKLQIYLRSSRAFYESFAEIYGPKVKNIREMFRIIGEQDVMVFGSGNWGKFLHRLIENKWPGKVKAFCDNRMAGNDLQNLPILPPQEAVNKYPEAVYVITGRRYEGEMRRQLQKLQIAEDHIFTYTAGIGDALLFQM